MRVLGVSDSTVYEWVNLGILTTGPMRFGGEALARGPEERRIPPARQREPRAD